MTVVDWLRSRVKDKVDLEVTKAKRKVAALALGVGLTAAGALLGLFALAFVLAAIGAAVATALPTWLALLTIGGGLVLLAGGLVFVGVSLLRKEE
jgi:hypothetical protein